MKQEKVIADLKSMIESQIERVQAFEEMDQKKLSLSPSADQWNVLQCLEHLNRYAAFYVETIGEKLKNPKGNFDQSSHKFKPGFFGKKFCRDMLPDTSGKIKKMNAFKSKNPSKQEVKIDSLQNFLDYQERWLEILERVKQFDLNRNKCKLTLPLLKMNLGSTLRFVIYHQERHIIQAETVLSQQ